MKDRDRNVKLKKNMLLKNSFLKVENTQKYKYWNGFVFQVNSQRMKEAGWNGFWAHYCWDVKSATTTKELTKNILGKL